MGSEKAILVVSFGTSYEETRRKTIDRIEEEIAAEFPQYAVYRAWTSGMIRRKLLKRDGLRIPDVKEALMQMHNDGVSEVIVQPTHVLNGIENDQMTQEVLACGECFQHVAIGAPLLTTQRDNDRIVQIIAGELHPAKDEALVLMGHGTEHYSNTIYAALDYQFHDMGYPNIFVGTVEAYPSFESVLKKVRASGLKRVLLTPFMIVAGDHANNDLAGEGKDSWKSRFEREGFEVQCVLKGLGEYEGVHSMFADHVREACENIG